jgi:hypothetical protein
LCPKNYDFGNDLRFLGRFTIFYDFQNHFPVEALPSLWNFWTIKYHHALFWKYGTLAGLGSKFSEFILDLEYFENRFKSFPENSKFSFEKCQKFV